MAIFARRRLEAMLSELRSFIGEEQALGLLKRLNDKRVEQSLPAEIELALVWSVSQFGQAETEPYWWGDSRRPDIYTESLLPGQAVAIEIAAPTDNSISGEAAMDKIALRICECADAAKKGVGSYLYFRFDSISGYEQGKYYRKRLAPPDHRLSLKSCEAIDKWIKSGSSLLSRLRIKEPGLSVEVERTDHVQTRHHNTWSSMPPETHSLVDNPLYSVLDNKRRQLRAAVPGTHRSIFLGDVGSDLLRRIGEAGEIDPTRRRVSGREIILHFLARFSGKIDSVVVFTAKRPPAFSRSRDIKWHVHTFTQHGNAPLASAMARLATVMPEPIFEGHQARSLFRQGAYAPSARGCYRGMSIEGGAGSVFRVRLPARALTDFLAGRIDEAEFRRYAGQRSGDSNLFRTWLDMGMTIANVEMTPRELDDDDDHIILTFSDDPGARLLRMSPVDNDI